MDGVKHEIDGVNLEIDGANHVKQTKHFAVYLSHAQSFQSSTLIQSSLVMKEPLGWSFDGALDPWSCL